MIAFSGDKFYQKQQIFVGDEGRLVAYFDLIKEYQAWHEYDRQVNNTEQFIQWWANRYGEPYIALEDTDWKLHPRLALFLGGLDGMLAIMIAVLHFSCNPVRNYHPAECKI